VFQGRKYLREAVLSGNSGVGVFVAKEKVGLSCGFIHLTIPRLLCQEHAHISDIAIAENFG